VRALEAERNGLEVSKPDPWFKMQKNALRTH
jgi:hypothetical protein